MVYELWQKHVVRPDWGLKGDSVQKILHDLSSWVRLNFGNIEHKIRELHANCNLLRASGFILMKTGIEMNYSRRFINKNNIGNNNLVLHG